MTLKELRRQKGMTQEDVANRLEIGVSTYCMYENAQRRIPADVAKKISELLNVDLMKFFSPSSFTISKS